MAGRGEGDAGDGEDVVGDLQGSARRRGRPVERGAGGTVGPNLAGIGSKKDRPYLLESILLPNKQIAPGFDAVTLKLKDGKPAVSGVLKAETDAEYSVDVVDKGIVKVAKSAVASRSPGQSPMPEGLGKALSKQDMRNLVEFLATLKAPEGEKTATAGGDDKLTLVGGILGTPAFLAPEQAAGDTIDGRTDIYALGALAYFLLTGRPPFTAKTTVKLLAAHLYETPEQPSRLRPEIPVALEAIVLRCLAKKPDERFSDVQELDRALAAAVPSGGHL